MNLLGVEAFVAVVNLGTLQQAADRLGLSAATISRRLAELEADLGVRLIERTTRSLRVTPLGRAYFDQCTGALRTIEEAGGLITSNEARVAGTVRVSTAANLGPLLLDAVERVHGAHPDVHVVLVETEHVLHPHNDDIELFVRVGAVAEERLVARPLGRYPHVLVASAGYVAKAGLPARPQELASHRLIAFDRPRRIAGVDLVPIRGGAPVHVDVRPVFSSNDYDTIAHAVRSGLGIAELPAILCGQRAGLVRILPQWTLGDVELHLLYTADRLLPKTVRVVLDAILATVPERIRSAVADLDA